MKILLTRPQEDSQKTARELASRGHEMLIAPLLDIRFFDGPELALGGVQAILGTSANGIRAFARRTARRDLSAYCVGKQTAQTARKAGFTAVKSADGDGIALANAVIGWARPEDGALFHPRGTQTRGAMADRLTAAGFAVRSEVLYEAVAIEKLPDDVAKELVSGTVDAVLLFSPRTAKTFVKAIRAGGLETACRGLRALCISPAAASELAPLEFARVEAAASPDTAALFARLG